MEASMTPLMTRPAPMMHEPEPLQEPLPQPEINHMEEEQPVYYYEQTPSVQKEEFTFPLDRQALIFLFAAFFVGFLLGSLRRPVILKA